mmetsp:Transcript_19354/g.46157  ORF Transcript_19354/g.46157 Transcript_19354/m.46157 type:complete len:294 (+) Transcript_19354:91-972(+)
MESARCVVIRAEPPLRALHSVRYAKGSHLLAEVRCHEDGVHPRVEVARAVKGAKAQGAQVLPELEVDLQLPVHLSRRQQKQPDLGVSLLDDPEDGPRVPVPEDPRLARRGAELVQALGDFQRGHPVEHPERRLGAHVGLAALDRVLVGDRVEPEDGVESVNHAAVLGVGEARPIPDERAPPNRELLQVGGREIDLARPGDAGDLADAPRDLDQARLPVCSLRGRRAGPPVDDEALGAVAQHLYAFQPQDRGSDGRPVTPGAPVNVPILKALCEHRLPPVQLWQDAHLALPRAK